MVNESASLNGRKRIRKSFAYFAVVLMSLMVLQTVAYPGDAEDVDVSFPVAGSETDPDLGVTSNSTNASASPNLNQSEKPPIYDNSTGCTVESLDSLPVPVISATDQLLMPPRISIEADTYVFHTTFGTYSINTSHPYALALAGSDGTPLVRESYFTIHADAVSVRPSNGTILEARNDSLLVVYDVVNVGEIPRTIGRMQLSVDFTSTRGPKMTSSVLKIDSKMEDWRVVWQIAPIENASIVCQGLHVAPVSLDSCLGMGLPSPNRTMEIRSPATAKDYS